MSIAIMSQVWSSSRQKGGNLLVLLALADAANDRGVAWLSVPNIADKARMGRRNAQYVLNELVADGELEDLGPHPDARYRGVTVYRVVIRAAEPEPATVIGPDNADAAEAQPAQPDAGAQSLRPCTVVPLGAHPGSREGRTPVRPIPSQPVRDPGNARARDPSPPAGDDQVDEPEPRREDPEARRAGNRARFVRELRELVVAADRDVEIDEWTGVGREAGARSFDELRAAVAWCVRAARRANPGAKVRWPSDALPFATSCRGWLRSQREAAAQQAEITDPEPADAGDGA